MLMTHDVKKTPAVKMLETKPALDERGRVKHGEIILAPFKDRHVKREKAPIGSLARFRRGSCYFTGYCRVDERARYILLSSGDFDGVRPWCIGCTAVINASCGI